MKDRLNEKLLEQLQGKKKVSECVLPPGGNMTVGGRASRRLTKEKKEDGGP